MYGVNDVVRQRHDGHLLQIAAGDHLVLLCGQHGLREVLPVREDQPPSLVSRGRHLLEAYHLFRVSYVMLCLSCVRQEDAFVVTPLHGRVARI